MPKYILDITPCQYNIISLVAVLSETLRSKAKDGAVGETRTLMDLHPLDFKSNAYTNSATTAC